MKMTKKGKNELVKKIKACGNNQKYRVYTMSSASAIKAMIQLID